MNIKHHGQLIEKIIRRDGHSITDIARLTNVNRRSVYNCTGMFPELKEEIDTEEVYVADTKTNQGSEVESPDWKEKYIDLLEKHAQLLSQISSESMS
jgi:transposase-like protein